MYIDYAYTMNKMKNLFILSFGTKTPMYLTLWLFIVSEVLTDLACNIVYDQKFQKNDKTLDREEGDALTNCVKICYATSQKKKVSLSHSIQIPIPIRRYTMGKSIKIMFLVKNFF